LSTCTDALTVAFGYRPETWVCKVNIEFVVRPSFTAVPSCADACAGNVDANTTAGSAKVMNPARRTRAGGGHEDLRRTRRMMVALYGRQLDAVKVTGIVKVAP
jgi:hypothetical protein